MIIKAMGVYMPDGQTKYAAGARELLAEKLGQEFRGWWLIITECGIRLQDADGEENHRLQVHSNWSLNPGS